MADYPPFMNAHGNIPKILDKIKEAKTPPKFTQDFLGTELGFTGGSARPFIPLAKRLGLLASDGTPTELYNRFRNPTQSGSAMADAIRRGYPTLFSRNEYTNKLDRHKLEGLVKEATGLESTSSTLNGIVGTFEALKSYANFDATEVDPGKPTDEKPSLQPKTDEGFLSQGDLRFSYTINLNLPNTTDIAVFNAIFKSLRENLLR